MPKPAFAALLVAAATLVAAPAPAEQDWPFYGGDQGGAKFSPLTDITPSTAARLAVAWEWTPREKALDAFGTRPGNFQTTPLMIDNVLYLSTPYNRVVALNAETGAELWAFDPKAYEDGQPPNGTGFVHRGVAAWRDTANGNKLRIFINSRYRLICLDAATGVPVESFGAGGAVDLSRGLVWEIQKKHYTNTSPPIVYKNLVILGNGVGDRLVYRNDPPGDIRAFDAHTGKQVWTFHTIPQPGEPGNDTWQQDSWSFTGHTNAWAPMTLDAERGLVFVPLGTPSNDFFGGRRPGANLFAESLVCLDANTGVRKWHYQLVHHGLWDYDNPSPPNLVTIRVDGRTIDAVVQLTKQGYTFVFDRVTGKPVWPIEERPVPASDVDWRAGLGDTACADAAARLLGAGRVARRRVRSHARVEGGGAKGIAEIPDRSAVHAAKLPWHRPASRAHRRRQLGRRRLRRAIRCPVLQDDEPGEYRSSRKDRPLEYEPARL